jgi:hypothetical protein
VAESPEKYVNDYSAEFLKDFMKLLSTRYWGCYTFFTYPFEALFNNMTTGWMTNQPI